MNEALDVLFIYALPNHALLVMYWKGMVGRGG